MANFKITGVRGFLSILVGFAGLLGMCGGCVGGVGGGRPADLSDLRMLAGIGVFLAGLLVVTKAVEWFME